ncbi:hypothetical protein D9599_16170 [Roseomonas sp. KE2513]|uniref:hypothetical protein n=1 Tax=Roseomonas sp. KE2513 TaxID=2479202 RepID=UPI0018DF34B3|nr:hypothetical protein [Roseomonas sp. KE2513]MBI0537108.1 hypothetical protein [Roseomonas sp. KE2513]
MLGSPGSLLDIGAGAGHPVLGWLTGSADWIAVEPSRYLRARLGRLSRTSHPALRPINALWQDIPSLALPRVEVAFAANTSGPLEAPGPLLDLMRQAARSHVAWIVPAQRGPRRWCLSGALPAVLHGEDETPAVAQILAALGPENAPSRMASFDWHFRASFAGPEDALSHCAAQLGLDASGPRRGALAEHLAHALKPLADGGTELVAPKKSALLVWDLA